MPVLTILVPVYNGEDHIRECVESALAQKTTEKFEVVVVDNASSDNTVNRILDLNTDSRLKIFRMREHVPIAASFNRSLKFATGEYVRFLCHDDILWPTCVEESITKLRQYPSVSLLTSFEKFLEPPDRIRNLESFPLTGFVEGRQARFKLFRYGNWIGGPTAVTLRRSSIGESNLFDPSLACCFDVDCWLRLLETSDVFVSSKHLFGSRVHHGQATNACRSGGFQREWQYLIRRELESERRLNKASKFLLLLAMAQNKFSGLKSMIRRI